MLFLFKANSKEMRALKPVYEQTVNFMTEKKDEVKEDEKEALESQLNDLSLRWEAIEESVNKQEILMDELEPKFKEYNEVKDRFSFWLQETEEKFEALQETGDATSKEFNNEAKVCMY